MAVQSVFEILDGLTSWTSKAKKKSAMEYSLTVQAAKAADAAANGAGGGGTGYYHGGGGGVSTDTDDTRMSIAGRTTTANVSSGSTRGVREARNPNADDPFQCIRALLAAVPKKLLGQAAMRIRAYARALRYFEQHAREMVQQKARSAQRGSTRGTSSSSGGGSIQRQPQAVDTSMTANQHTNTSSLLSYCIRNDGSSGGLPDDLDASQLDQLTAIFAKLDDPDALQGVQMLRQMYGYENTARNRITELEQTDDWMSALAEYGSLQAEIAALPVEGVVEDISSTIASSSSASSSSSSSSSTRPSGVPMVVEQVGCTNNPQTAIDMQTDVERGRLRCLMEIGHLEAVIDQTLGTVQVTTPPPHLSCLVLSRALLLLPLPLPCPPSSLLLQTHHLTVYPHPIIIPPSTFHSLPSYHPPSPLSIPFPLIILPSHHVNFLRVLFLTASARTGSSVDSPGRRSIVEAHPMEGSRPFPQSHRPRLLPSIIISHGGDDDAWCVRGNQKCIILSLSPGRIGKFFVPCVSHSHTHWRH